MTQIIDLEQIKKVLPVIDLTEIMAQGFKAYTRGEVVVPPVGELLFEDPPGEAHIKYGYIKGDAHYVVKITVADLTGVAVQDIGIADAVFDRCRTVKTD